MPPNRSWSPFLAAATLLTLASHPARADVDMTGRWLNSLPTAGLTVEAARRSWESCAASPLPSGGS